MNGGRGGDVPEQCAGVPADAASNSPEYLVKMIGNDMAFVFQNDRIVGTLLKDHHEWRCKFPEVEGVVIITPPPEVKDPFGYALAVMLAP